MDVVLSFCSFELIKNSLDYFLFDKINDVYFYSNFILIILLIFFFYFILGL